MGIQTTNSGAAKSLFAELGGNALRDLIKVFVRIDTDGNGAISYQEFKLGLRSIGKELSPDRLASLWATFDASGDGELQLDEFKEIMAAEMRGESHYGGDKQMIEIISLFNKIDVDGDGCVSQKELKRGVKLLMIKDKKMAKVLGQVLLKFDDNRQGDMQLHEFQALVNAELAHKRSRKKEKKTNAWANGNGGEEDAGADEEAGAAAAEEKEEQTVHVAGQEPAPLAPSPLDLGTMMAVKRSAHTFRTHLDERQAKAKAGAEEALAREQAEADQALREAQERAMREAEERRDRERAAERIRQEAEAARQRAEAEAEAARLKAEAEAAAAKLEADKVMAELEKAKAEAQAAKHFASGQAAAQAAAREQELERRMREEEAKQAKREAEEQERREEEERRRREVEEARRKEEEERARQEEERARKEAEERFRRETERRIRQEAEKVKQEAMEEAAKAKAEAERIRGELAAAQQAAADLQAMREAEAAKLASPSTSTAAGPGFGPTPPASALLPLSPTSPLQAGRGLQLETVREAAAAAESEAERGAIGAEAVVLKLSCGSDMRRVQLVTSSAAGRSVGGLMAMVERTFPTLRDQGLSEAVLTYRDEDNDVITIGTDEDVTEAVKVAVEGKASLRLTITLPEPKREALPVLSSRAPATQQYQQHKEPALTAPRLAQHQHQYRQEPQHNEHRNGHGGYGGGYGGGGGGGQPPPQQQQQQPARSGHGHPSMRAAAHVAAVGVHLSREEVRDHLWKFYSEHNPKRLSSLDAIMERFRGREMKMIDMLYEKYHHVPNPFRSS
eukprot:g1229.t1